MDTLPDTPEKMDIINRINDINAVMNLKKKDYYASHFYEFNRDVLGWPDIYEPLHRKVCNFVTDNINKKKILLLLPRGTFKSSIVTVGYSLYQIAQNPNDRMLIGNATYPMAVSFLSQIKNHLTKNQSYKNIFGDFSAEADSWREDRIAIAREKSYEQKDPTIWAYGMGGNLVGSHFDMAILDDVVNRDNIGNKEQIEKTKNFYRDVLDLIDPMPSGHKRMIIIGTTWHYDDLYAWIMDKDNNVSRDFAVMRLPAYEGEWGKGELLFPTRLNWETLEKLKNDQGLAHYSAQYMLNPIPEEEQKFKGPFKKYEETDLKGIPLNKYVAIDPALSEKKDADYSAMVCVGVDKNNVWYILDVWRDRVVPQRLLDQIFFWYDKWHPMSFGLETTAYQRVLQYALVDQMKKRNKFIPLRELTHTEQSKSERILALQPRYETGMIWHPNKTHLPMVEYLEDELLRFPLGKNDDIIDSLASVLELASAARIRDRNHNVYHSSYPA